ncbi:MAG: glycine cleavage system aminomethyltransferase GcvT [Planctomycetaceae bacterium]|jgi:aminomethyltransferase|nr:glycine cleavage system aminomethyltransferase GcvT [Planctomycetaceae bacterium]
MLSLLRTPLYDWHCSQFAQMTEWDGWEMPKQYASVLYEYETLKNRVGVTDLSHKGRFVFAGPDAGQFLSSLLSRNIDTLKTGRLQYSLLLNQSGGILDDVLVGLFQRTDSGLLYYYVITNAANREKDNNLFRKFLAPESAAQYENKTHFSDETNDQSMISVQGPHALELLKPLFQTDIAALSSYSGVETSLSLSGRWAMVFRTGYLENDRFEIVLESFFVEQFVADLFQQGLIFGITPVGFAATDIIRQESAIPCYGCELDETVTPYEAGLSHAVHLDGREFPGSGVLSDLKSKTPEKLRVFLETDGEFPAVKGNGLFCKRKEIGQITSGIFSPMFQKNIAMGYVPYEFSQPGQVLNVKIRDKICKARVVPAPQPKPNTPNRPE